MEGRHEVAPPPLVGRASHTGDSCLGLEEELRREVAEGDDDSGVDEPELLAEVPLASLDLVGSRVPVARGTTLHNVGDVHIASFESDLTKQPIEELAGSTDEGDPLLVFVLSRGFADEHDVGFRVPIAEHNLRASFRKTAGGARKRFDP